MKFSTEKELSIIKDYKAGLNTVKLSEIIGINKFYNEYFILMGTI